jgi:hypothetical protein
MNDTLKWCLKVILHAAFWVFALSIRWDGRPLFYYANDTLVQNTVVRTIDESMADVWHRVTRAAKVAFAKNAPDDTHAF